MLTYEPVNHRPHTWTSASIKLQICFYSQAWSTERPAAVSCELQQTDVDGTRHADISVDGWQLRHCAAAAVTCRPQPTGQSLWPDLTMMDGTVSLPGPPRTLEHTNTHPHMHQVCEVRRILDSLLRAVETRRAKFEYIIHNDNRKREKKRW